MGGGGDTAPPSRRGLRSPQMCKTAVQAQVTGAVGPRPRGLTGVHHQLRHCTGPVCATPSPCSWAWVVLAFSSPLIRGMEPAGPQAPTTNAAKGDHRHRVRTVCTRRSVLEQTVGKRPSPGTPKKAAPWRLLGCLLFLPDGCCHFPGGCGRLLLFPSGLWMVAVTSWWAVDRYNSFVRLETLRGHSAVCAMVLPFTAETQALHCRIGGSVYEITPKQALSTQRVQYSLQETLKKWTLQIQKKEDR